MEENAHKSLLLILLKGMLPAELIFGKEMSIWKYVKVESMKERGLAFQQLVPPPNHVAHANPSYMSYSFQGKHLEPLIEIVYNEDYGSSLAQYIPKGVAKNMLPASLHPIIWPNS